MSFFVAKNSNSADCGAGYSSCIAMEDTGHVTLSA